MEQKKPVQETLLDFVNPYLIFNFLDITFLFFVVFFNHPFVNDFFLELYNCSRKKLQPIQNNSLDTAVPVPDFLNLVKELANHPFITSF